MPTEAERFQQAVEAYQLADYESAITEFQALFQETGRTAYNWNLGMAYLRAYQFDNAKYVFSQFVGQVPSGTSDERVKALEAYYMASVGMGDSDLGFHQP